MNEPVGRRVMWWAVGFGSPLALFAVAQLAAWAADQNATARHALGRLNFLPELGFTAWLPCPLDVAVVSVQQEAQRRLDEHHHRQQH